MVNTGFSRFKSAFIGLQLGIGLFTLLTLTPDYRLKDQRIRYITRPLVISTSKNTPPRHAFEEALRLSSVSEKKSRNTISDNQQTIVNLNASLADKSSVPVRMMFYRRVHLKTMSLDSRELAKENQPQQRQQAEVLPQPRLAQSAASNNAEAEWYASLSPRQKRILESSGIHNQEIFEEEPKTLSQVLAEKVSEARGDVVGSASEQTASVIGDRPVKISGRMRVAGHILLDHTTPLLPDHHIEVHWMREGVARATGRQLKDSAFAVEVDEPVGQVRAEMYGPSGAIVAQGSLRLSPQQTAEQLSNVQLRMQPTRTVAAHYRDFNKQAGSDNKEVFSHSLAKMGALIPNGKVMAKASFDDQTAFEVDGFGGLTVDGVSPMSSAFAYTESKDYYPAIHRISTQSKNQILPLIPQKTAEALMEIVEEQLAYTSSQKNGALILGRVVSQGAPVNGVKIQVEGAPHIRPVYLNEILIPDPKLTETTSSGYFVFVHPTEGYYSIRGEKGGQFFGFGNVSSEANSSSFVSVEQALHSAPFEMRSFSAFSGEPVATEVSVQAKDQIFTIEGYGLVDHPVVSGQSMAQVQPLNAEYMPSLFAYEASEDFLHMPLVKRVWVDKLIGQARINIIPNSGMILGFTRKGGYELSLPHLTDSSEVKVIYFDSQGNVTPAPIDQGGFLLVNVPDLAQTIVMTDALGQILSQVVPVDAGWMSISRFDL